MNPSQNLNTKLQHQKEELRTWNPRKECHQSNNKARPKQIEILNKKDNFEWDSALNIYHFKPKNISLFLSLGKIKCKNAQRP